MPVFSFFVWLALVAGAGWLAFPLSRRVFENVLPDAGLAFGRILFLAIWTMLTFYAGQIGVPVVWSAGFYLVLALFGIALWRRDRAQLTQTLRAHARAIRLAETLFLLVFLAFFVQRGFWSDTEGNNGEKGMDSALIAGLTRAQRLPPPNPYAAGTRLRSYYYFGHLETALLTRASFTTTRWSYNWMCATIPALCFPALFSLGAALTGRLKGGAFVVAAVFLSGTLEPLWQWLNLKQNWGERFLGLEPFSVSRVIPYTINEFPWFTFNQGDLHAHYFDFPFQLALMALAWSLFRAKRAGVAMLAALLLGAQILTNTWDFPIYLLLVIFALVSPGAPPQLEDGAPAETERAPNARAHSASVACASAQSALAHPALKNSASAHSARARFAQGTRHLALGLAVAAIALALGAPFLLGVRSAALPPQLLPQPASPLREWLLLWAPIALGWWSFAALVWFERARAARWALLFVGAGIVIWALLWPPAVPSWGVWVVISVSAALAIVGAFWARETRFLCLLAGCGVLALVWSETTWAGFMGDAANIGIDDFKRQDTVFKFGLQAWMLWGTASAAGLWLAWERGSKFVRRAALIVAIPLATIMLAGTLSVTVLRTYLWQGWLEWSHGQSKQLVRFQAWDAWAHLAPPEQEAARWLETNVAPGQNIVEAEKLWESDFSLYTRYAHATGIPTIIGPLSHSFYWSPANAPVGRDAAGRRAKAAAEWAEVRRRKAEVRLIYSPIDIARRDQLLRRYGVKYLIWGELERQEYGADIGYNLASSLDIAAQFGDLNDPHRVIIFRVN